MEIDPIKFKDVIWPACLPTSIETDRDAHADTPIDVLGFGLDKERETNISLSFKAFRVFPARYCSAKFNVQEGAGASGDYTIINNALPRKFENPSVFCGSGTTSTTGKYL